MTEQQQQQATGAKVSAQGHPIVLGNGQQVRLRFGMRSLVMVEEHFGGVEQMQKALGDDLSRPVFTPLLRCLLCALADERQTDGTAWTFDALLDVVEPKDFEAYVEQVGQAMLEAFPTLPPNRAARRAKAQPRASQAASRGRTGTTSAPSPSAAATASSGA